MSFSIKCLNCNADENSIIIMVDDKDVVRFFCQSCHNAKIMRK